MLTKLEKERFRKSIEAFCPMDDTFAQVLFQNKKCTQEMLRIILDDDKLIVRASETQVSIGNLHGRAIRMDVKAVLSDERVCDVELQHANGGASPKRARYYSSLLDADITEPGEEYSDIPETFVIFVTERDVLGYGLPIYHIDRIVRETGKLFEDGTRIIYVNGERHETKTKLGRLVHDLFCTTAADMYNSEIADETRRLKETEGGTKMCEIMEKLIAEEVAEKSKNMAVDMYNDGMSLEKIAKYVSTDVDTVKKWLEEAPAPTAR